MLVRITSFDDVNNKVDLQEEGVTSPISETGVLASSFSHATDTVGSELTNALIVKTTSGTLSSFYPMAGGKDAQHLHQLHLMLHTLTEVQTQAQAMGINIGGKDQASLTVEIIQTECSNKGVNYLL